MIPYRSHQKGGRFPFLTVGFILVNIVVFIYEISLSPQGLDQLILEHGVTPSRFEPPDLISSLFLHGSWLHLIANMLYLWVFGRKIEQLLGLKKFLFFYFATGIIATLVQSGVDWSSSLPQIGASGAIAGILGFYLRLAPRALISVLVPIFIFWRRFILPAWAVLGFWFVLELLQAYFSFSTPQATNVALFAHVGGFIFGLLFGPFFDKKKIPFQRKKKR
ncbi:MAG: rhomboid family intramembrane serine protease [bacterium]|nr:rhomboid family intramembrane serine protease [bacterium]